MRSSRGVVDITRCICEKIGIFAGIFQMNNVNAVEIQKIMRQTGATGAIELG